MSSPNITLVHLNLDDKISCLVYLKIYETFQKYKFNSILISHINIFLKNDQDYYKTCIKFDIKQI
jgi:hypothetical protein